MITHAEDDLSQALGALETFETAGASGIGRMAGGSADASGMADVPQTVDMAQTVRVSHTPGAPQPTGLPQSSGASRPEDARESSDVTDVAGGSRAAGAASVTDVADVANAPGIDDRAERLGGLLLRAQAGDRGSLHAIVAELTPLLWNVARGQGLDRSDAEDVVQSVWLSLVARLAHIETPNALIGWLVTACKREAWRARTARDRSRSVEVAELAELVDPAPPAEDRVLADERMRVVRAALERLTPRCAELLRLLAVADRPDYSEIAGALGMPRGSVGPTRGRCLAKLREILLADGRWSAVCP